MVDTNYSPFLKTTQPMPIYETLYAFKESYGKNMGEQGTHPWSQGFPVTTQIPGGPPILTSVDGIKSADLHYPKAYGMPALREKIASYYKDHYQAEIEPDNIMVFAGGKPALWALLLFLRKDVTVRIGEVEYPAYASMFSRAGTKVEVVASNESNKFKPANEEYLKGDQVMAMFSNPSNPTGHTKFGDELEDFVKRASSTGKGALIDEAYEMIFKDPVSSLKYIRNIDQTNIFVTGAATKGLQAPGIRIGWCIASKKNIEILGNYSTITTGGVSHLSQLYCVNLLEKQRVIQARKAVPEYYGSQRERYSKAFKDMGLEVWSGDGGFYLWVKIPGNFSAAELNKELFKHGAAVLSGQDCDMNQVGDKSPFRSYFRFSFGPLLPESFEDDIRIMKAALESLQKK